MSKKIEERTKELATREIALKKKLMGSSEGIKSKANKVGKTALIGGLATLLTYGLYKAFFQGESKSKKSKIKQGQSTSGIITEKLVMFLLPYLGKVLDDFLEKKMSKPLENPEAKEENAAED
ncbi:MAG: hypothetical protein ABJG78_05385 [Cyclobacteriaceae bacterium]